MKLEIEIIGEKLQSDIEWADKVCGNIYLKGGDFTLWRLFDEGNNPYWTLQETTQGTQ